MAPTANKAKEQLAPTPASIAAGLASTDVAQQLQALAQLTAAPIIQSELVEASIPEKLVSIVQQQPADKSARLLACRLIASSTGPAQAATCLLPTIQALWGVLESYQAAEAAIAAALADPAAAKAAALPRKPGQRDCADPDDWLPGPSKFLLEAALRALASLAAAPTPADAQTGQAASGDAGTPAFDAAAGWLEARDAAVLECLLRHPSGKVQMRAARLAHQLARSSSWCEAFAATGGVAAAIQGAFATCTSSSSASSSIAVKLHAVKLLWRLVAHGSHLAIAVMVGSRRLADALMEQLVDAGGGAATMAAMPATPSKAKAASMAAAAAAAESAKPYVPDALQQASAQLLAALCTASEQFCEQLVQQGGVAALQALLPEAPALQPAADDTRPATSSSGSSGGGGPGPAAGGSAGLSRLELRVPPATSREPTPRGGSTAGPTPRTATGSTRGGSPCTAPADQPASRTPADGGSYPMPAGKLTSPQLQAQVLLVLAAVMSQPGMVQSMLLQTRQVQSGLPRLLLHLFAPAPPAPPPPAPAAAVSITAGEGSNPAPAPAAGAAAAKAAGAKAAPGKGPLAPVAAKKAGAGGADAGGSLTPRKGSSSGTTNGKDAAKASEVPPPPPAAAVPDPLSPPFPAVVKAAALACLAQLAADREAVTLLAEQQVVVVPPPQAAQAAAGVPLPTQPQQVAGAPSEQAAGGGGVGGAAGQQQQQSAKLVLMLQLMLQDLQLQFGGSSAPDASRTGATPGNATATTGGDQAAASRPAPEQVPPPAAANQPAELGPMLESAATVLAGLAEHLEEQQLQQLPLLTTLKVLARCTLLQQHASPQPQLAVSRALLVLPEEVLFAPVQLPLPSPPATPPPPPLPTNLYAWDALDRPAVTDGAVLA